jgi:hypothetical protein
MNKKTLFLVVALASAQQLFAQSPNIEKETWADKPAIHAIDSKYSKEAAVVISDTRRIEFADASKDEIDEYYTIHKIVHINDDRGIEGFNKIYLGLSENSDIVDVKARSILADGKILELDKNDIKDIKEEDGNTYKIFALNGLEKGCEVEYFYTFKKSTTYFGREIVQERIPILATTVQVIGPARLKFEVKSYNFNVSASDTVINNKRIAQCIVKNTPGLDEEKYAYFDANVYRIEYKLSYNTSGSSTERMFTWNELAKRVYSVYTDYSDKEYRAASDLVTANGWDKLTDEVAKITAVEDFIKKNFTYNEDLNSADGNALATVLHVKIGGTIGTMRLYTAIFQNLGVNYQYVLSGNREKFAVDRQFEDWNNCEYPIFYFPTENKFLAPTRPDYRYPWIFPSWAGTNGLFCKKMSLGNLTTAVADIKTVPAEPYDQTVQNLEARLELNPELDSLSIDEKQIFQGYASVNYRDAFNYSNDEQKKNIIKELTKAFANSENILFSEVLNQGFEDETPNKPLILHTKTKSGELIERAGNKLLLKIGMAIGPQVEMYQEKPRQEPVDFEFGHIEERKIDFVIPDGYTISNPNDLKISQTYTDNGEQTMGFVCSYEIKGNLLSVHIVEQYHHEFYPMEQFDTFRKIINSSADFNKVVLVLEKKG